MAQTSNGLPLGRLIAFGIPGVPLAAAGLPLFIFLPTFYSSELGVGLTAVGAALLVSRLWDVATDPVVGALSDRTKSRFGRRKPWILLGLPLLMLSIWMLFRPPVAVDIWYLAGWSFAVYLAWTMIALPHGAWGAEISNDYHERSRISAAREVCVVLGTVIAAAMPAILGGGAGEAPEGDVLSVLAIALMIALPVSVGAALLWVPDRRVSDQKPTPWRDGLKLLKANLPFRRLIIAYLLNGVANGLPATLFLLFVQHVLEAKAQQGLLLLVYFFCGILSVPLWLWLSRHWGKHRTWCIAMILNCVFFATVPFLGAGDAMLFLGICVLTGLCLGADLTLPASIQADVVDVDTAEGGERRTGLYFAFWGMATKLALALAVGVAFPALDLAGFDTGGGNTPWALLSLALLYGGAPILFKLGAIGLMWKFPLDESVQRDLRDRIARIETDQPTRM